VLTSSAPLRVNCSSKLRHARERVERSRPFHEVLGEAIAGIQAGLKETPSVYSEVRPVKKTCFVVIGGDRGLKLAGLADVLENFGMLHGQMVKQRVLKGGNAFDGDVHEHVVHDSVENADLQSNVQRGAAVRTSFPSRTARSIWSPSCSTPASARPSTPVSPCHVSAAVSRERAR